MTIQVMTAQMLNIITTTSTVRGTDTMYPPGLYCRTPISE